MIKPMQVEPPVMEDPKPGGMVDSVKRGKFVEWICEGKELDKQEQIDRIEAKLDSILDGLKYLTGIQPK